MIDIGTEHLLRISDVPGYLAGRGVRVSRRAVYAWVAHGLLEVVEVGGILHTSREAVQRHAERGRRRAGDVTVDQQMRAGAAARRLEEAGW